MTGITRPGADYPLLSRKDVMYPDSDGKPMSDNTLQFEWITALHFGFAALYADDPQVFVASDLLWYPVEGQPKIRCAPDVLLAFGRPKGHRGSYQQWREEGVPPQVVFEILSPGNTAMEMIQKHRFYEVHGVEEYYIYDPDEQRLEGYLRTGDQLRLLPEMNGWISPRTGVKMELREGQLACTRPDGEPFLTYLQMMEKAEDARDEARAAVELAALETQRANSETQRADAETQRADAETQRAEKLAAKLRELGIDPANL